MSVKSYNQPAQIVKLTGASQQIKTGSTVLMGISIMDEAAGPVKVQVYNGTDDTGDHILQVSINASSQQYYWFGPNGIACPNGIYLKVYSGVPTGAAFIR